MMKPRSLNAGALRHRVVIEAPVDADDGAGGVTRSYQDVDVAWAQIDPIDAEAIVVDNRRVMRVTQRVTLRWRGDIDSRHRLRVDGRILTIRSVSDPDARQRALILIVEEDRA